jgi:hypothetical protein
VPKFARAAVPTWNGAIRAGSVPFASSRSAAAKEKPQTNPRFCRCGGRLRYRDSRRHRLPGVSQGHRWVCESCGAIKTRWEAATPEERAREREQSRAGPAPATDAASGRSSRRRRAGRAPTAAASFQFAQWISTTSTAPRSSRSPTLCSALSAADRASVERDREV